MGAGGNDIKAGRAYVELTGKDTLSKVLDRVGGRFKAWGKQITKFGKFLSITGAAVTAPLLAAAKASADSGAAIYDMSKRTGISVEKLSALSYAADQTGTSAEGLETGVKKMQKAIVEAGSGSDEARGALNALRLSYTELKSLSPDQQFEKIAAALAKVKDPTQRAALAMKLFGKSGTELLPLVENLDALEGEAAALGLIRTTASAQQAKAFSVEMYKAGRAVKSLWGSLAGPIIPLLREKTQWLMRAALAARGWVRENSGLVVLAFKVGSALTVAGAALAIFGKGVGTVGPGLKVIASTLGAILSPIGLTVAALAALGGYFFYATEAGQKTLSYLGERFGDLKTSAVTAFQGITDALRGGNWKLAAQVAATEMKIVWVQLKNWLNDLWAGVAQTFVRWMTIASAEGQKVWLQFKNWFATLTSDIGNQWEVDVQERLINARQDLLNQAASRGDTKEADRLQKLIDQARKDRQKALDQFAKGHAGDPDLARKLREIEDEKAKKLAQIDKLALAGQTQSVAKLKTELQGLTTQLNNLRQQAGPLYGPPKKPAATPADSKLPTIDDVVGALSKASASTTATFSPYAAGLLGGGSLMKQVVANTKQTADATRDTARRLQYVKGLGFV